MKRNGKKSRKIRKLIIASTLSAIVLIVSTYTWFIGMQTVNVKPFEINIASTEGLFLSLDGEKWLYNLDDIASLTAYTGNTNNFETGTNPDGTTDPNPGLVPMSSVGDLDANVSRMKLFDKGSLTTSPGGYRLLSARVNNYATSEKMVNSEKVTVVSQGDGYIVFDLFIKNLSGNAYYPTNEPLNEEAIYLTTDSEVKVVTNGSDRQDETGIQNSIRVAFAQIGRVEATTTTASVITSMDCDGDSTNKVTGICRNAQIWEPNDTKHVQNAINWYEKSCAKRTGDIVTDKSSYVFTGNVPTACTTISQQVGVTGEYQYVPTYAISRDLGINDNVDIYDGPKYNTYTKNYTSYATYEAATGEAQSAYKLVEFPYFTDTMKDKKGTERPTFMTLAPNSITKVRVYIWLEGQDIDNYDFALVGRKISVNFGFTKERFTEEDVDYVGPAFETSDNASLETSEAQS